MPRPDKSPTRLRAVVKSMRRGAGFGVLVLALAISSGCNRMATPRSAQVLKDADAKFNSGDLLEAISLYESAIDGTARSADVHYKLALIYDDKMKDPLSALHHFKRYLTLAPGGAKATEVKNFMKRDEIALLTALSGDSLVTRAEAVRLKNENLNLRKEIEERSAQLRNASAAEKAARGGRAEKASPAAKAKGAARSHVVQPGDTLFSLSRLFYNSPDGWKDILEANRNSIDDPEKLTVGKTLTIPAR